MYVKRVFYFNILEGFFMKKWADKVIVAVHYEDTNDSRRVIEKVKVEDDDGDNLKNKVVMLRKSVVADIENNISYVTAYKNDDDKYEEGKKVIIDIVDGVKYIKTEKNNKTEDNLDKLEEL